MADDQTSNNSGDGSASDKGDREQTGKNQDQKGKDQDQKGDKTVPYARFQEANQKAKDLEKELKEVADGLLEDVPEDFRDLVPDLPPGKLIKWLRGAFAKGLFNPPKADALDSKRPGDKQKPDLDKLSPLQMREMGYKS